MTDRLIRIPDFAAKIATGTKTAKRIAAEAGLPMFRIGGQLRLRESDVTAYLDGQQIEPTVPAINLKTLVHAAVERAKKRRAS